MDTRNTFTEWKAVVKANDVLGKMNFKKLFWSNLIKAAILSPFAVIALVLVNSAFLADSSSVILKSLSWAGTLMIPMMFLFIIMVTPDFFKLHELQDETSAQIAWAKAHGLRTDKSLPTMRSYLAGSPEQVFTQRIGKVFNVYRLANEDGNAVLYDAKGVVVEEDPSRIKVAKKATAEDPNNELWRVAAVKHPEGA
jgi:hypothetical protein